jgi:hypothetical protein
MYKIINKGLNEKGVKEMNKHFESNRLKYPEENFPEYVVGMRIGNSSKLQKRLKTDTTMGFYGIRSVEFGWVQIPLEWLNYEVKEV